MRALVLLTCLVSGGIGAAVADTPPPTSTVAAASEAAAPAAAAAPTATLPATAATKAAATSPADTVATAAAQKQTNFERHLIAEGYKVEMRGGEKYYCRTEENVIGSRLGNTKNCASADQLAYREHSSKEYTEQLQRQMVIPTGH